MAVEGHAAEAAPAFTPFKSLTDAALSRIRQIYNSVPPTREALDALFAVDAAQIQATDAWIGFFVETACAQLIWDDRPTGTLTATDAAWVLARFDEAPSFATLALLVRLLEEAVRLPPDFTAQVRQRAALFNTKPVTAREGKPKSVPYLRLVA